MRRLVPTEFVPPSCAGENGQPTAPTAPRHRALGRQGFARCRGLSAGDVVLVMPATGSAQSGARRGCGCARSGCATFQAEDPPCDPSRR